ncbi:hypothetical protein HHK36_012764 [Tetracentron sinense]|uniref:CCHC-type domain-containing protein n=1 Tax=Tetracentron sinense TaxID=13715 RepID=A0A835DFT3_TETSI|nr:hypothetical protein HHK36_012764 [Tetracentron sinense]
MCITHTHAEAYKNKWRKGTACMLRAMDGTAFNSIGLSGFPTEHLRKINVDNNDDEPMRKLGLALGSSDHYIQKGLNNDSGAGANAGSRTDMRFVTSNCLSELVWSPNKGLSLKCTDCSLAEKKHSLIWGTGSSNMVLSPPQSITAKGTNNDRPVSEGNLISSQMAFHLESEVSERVTSARSPRSTAVLMPVCRTSHEHNMGPGGGMEELNTEVKVSVLDFTQKVENYLEKKAKVVYGLADDQTTAISGTVENIVSTLSSKASSPGPKNGMTAESLSIEMDESKPDLAQIKPGSGNYNKELNSDPFDRSRDVGTGNQTADMEVALATEVFTIKQCKAPNTPVPILTSPGTKHEVLASVVEYSSKNKMMTPAESDLQPLKGKSAFAEVVRVIESQPVDEVKHSHQQNKEMLPKDKAASINVSPNNSKLQLCQRKVKRKGLSDGEVSGGLSKEDDDSNESVESCNSVGLFSAGKRQWSFEQQLITESKRVKKQIQESPRSASLIRRDSSFMSWISNMMKGLSKSDQDETPYVALTNTPHHGHENPDQKLISHDKNQDPGHRNIGFQTIFQALYCANTGEQETRMSDFDHQMEEGSKEYEMANKISDNITTPMACGDENDKLCKQLLTSKEKFNQGTSGDGEGPSTQPNFSSTNLSIIQATHKTNTAKNKNSCNMASGSEKGGVNLSNSSFSKWKTSFAENKFSDLPSEGKVTYNVGLVDPNKSLNSATNRSGPLGSLWIARFSPKVSGPSNHNMGSAVEGSTDCTRPLAHSQNCFDSSKDQKDSVEARDPSAEDLMDGVGKKWQNCVVNTKVSLGLKTIKGQTDQKFKSKLNPILHSQHFKSSEAKASVFASRLDALRHIIPSGMTENANRANTTCFFCGKRGHNLRDCSEITETELEDLLRNDNSYNGAEDSPYHWAVACPSASSRMQNQLDSNASLVNYLSKMKHDPGNDTLTNNDERNLEMNKDRQCLAGAHTVWDGKDPKVDAGIILYANLNQISSALMASNERISDSKAVKKHIASRSGENELKENDITPFCNFVERQIPVVPEGTFEAIRKLRLSRADILKWMKSPLFCLDGFFLRLRQWKEGLRGAGYYMACINGALGERSSGSSKTPLSVNIGGLKCLVESRYVSNHDFIEEELMAWWCAISRCGGKLPSEEYLKNKLEERKKFGF